MFGLAMCAAIDILLKISASVRKLESSLPNMSNNPKKADGTLNGFNNMKEQIKQFAQKVKLNLENRRVIRARRDNNRKLFTAGFMAFNSGPTYFNTNRDNKRSVSKVTVDRTSIYS